MENVRVIPGPVNKELLFLETEHRAYPLFHKGLSDTATLKVRRADQKLWSIIKNNPIPPKVMEYIRAAGFGGVFDCGYKLVDHSLVTALVERWRPETNTFHLPIGEVTITLQDVQVLWGLRVEGDAVTGKEEKWTYEKSYEMCVRLLGFAPESGYFRCGQMKARYLRDHLETALPENAPDYMYIQKARVYILLLLSGVLFPDTSDTTIQMFLLRLIEDLDKCSRISWGSAVLACLYRNLCKATSPEAIEISGPLTLLQLWAWCRLPGTSPNLQQVDFTGKPYGARWNCPLTFGQTPSHMLVGIRSVLHALQDDEFKWTPYDDVLGSLADICKSDQENWVSDTYVIYWEIVEECLPSRVMRQFHLLQTIPNTPISSVDEHRKLHKVTRRGSTTKDWRNVHHAQINRWNNRVVYSINGEFSPVSLTVDGYMDWYWPRTVLFITNPGPGDDHFYRSNNLGGTLEIAVDGFSRIYQQMGNIIGNEPHIPPYVQNVYDISQRYLHLTHANERRRYRSTHVVENDVPIVSPVMNRLQRVPRRGNRQGDQRRMLHDETNPNFGQTVNRQNSHVSFRGFDINEPWIEDETQEEEPARLV